MSINSKRPRMVYIDDITTRPVFNSGSLLISPAPEKAYNPHMRKIITMKKVRRSGSREPFSSNFAICSPAPQNRYQSGPPKIIAICSNATKILNVPPDNRYLFISASLNNSLVYQGLKLIPDRENSRCSLGKKNRNHILFRINYHIGCGITAPAELVR
jgi:hypothetical protein